MHLEMDFCIYFTRGDLALVIKFLLFVVSDRFSLIQNDFRGLLILIAT